MSSSRSVAAAQRRRVGPPEPQQTSRGPNTSIQSSQAFTQQQIQPGTSGRLAGQHAALQQQQQQQRKQQTQSQSQNVGNNKMTIPQAITLITLRLGRVENKLQNLDSSNLEELDEEGNSIPNYNSINDTFSSSILERLDCLEKSSIDDTLSSNILDRLQRLDSLEKSLADVPNIKQQMEVFKPTVVKNTSLVTGLVKEIKDLKNVIENMKNDFILTQSLVKDLQLLINPPQTDLEDENIQEQEQEQEEESTEREDISTNVNLKEIIEQELNAV